MSKEAMKLALEALECKDGWGSSSRVLKERAITSLRTALSASKIEGDLMQRFYDGEEAKSLISEAEEAIRAIREAPTEPVIKQDLTPEQPSGEATIAQPQQCKYPNCSYPCLDLPDCRDAPQPAQPQGWKLVPVEPTPEQIKEGNKVTWPLPCAQVYSAMLAAAPQPAQQEPVACFNVFRSTTGERNTRFLELKSLPDGEHYFYTSPPAQQEPVAALWQHGRTGRTRITMPGDITDCDADWFKAADLYTSPPAQRKPLADEQWQSIADTLGCFITRGQKDAIEAALGIKENT